MRYSLFVIALVLSVVLSAQKSAYIAPMFGGNISWSTEKFQADNWPQSAVDNWNENGLSSSYKGVRVGCVLGKTLFQSKRFYGELGLSYTTRDFMNDVYFSSNDLYPICEHSYKMFETISMLGFTINPKHTIQFSLLTGISSYFVLSHNYRLYYAFQDPVFDNAVIGNDVKHKGDAETKFNMFDLNFGCRVNYRQVSFGLLYQYGLTDRYPKNYWEVLAVKNDYELFSYRIIEKLSSLNLSISYHFYLNNKKV